MNIYTCNNKLTYIYIYVYIYIYIFTFIGGDDGTIDNIIDGKLIYIYIEICKDNIDEYLYM
jgi:hypothetical protein